MEEGKSLKSIIQAQHRRRINSEEFVRRVKTLGLTTEKASPAER